MREYRVLVHFGEMKKAPGNTRGNAQKKAWEIVMENARKRAILAVGKSKRACRAPREPHL